MSPRVKKRTYEFDYMKWQPNNIKNSNKLYHHDGLEIIFSMILVCEKRSPDEQVIDKKPQVDQKRARRAK